MHLGLSQSLQTAGNLVFDAGVYTSMPNSVCRALFLAGLFLTPALCAVPDAPTGVEASDKAYTNKIVISWEHVRDAQIYRVFRNDSPDPSGAVSLGITESITFTDVAGPA
ncbi:MAG: hypothetical protein ABI995_17240, partial [Acidobacteriota bacterium]